MYHDYACFMQWTKSYNWTVTLIFDQMKEPMIFFYKKITPREPLLFHQSFSFIFVSIGYRNTL